MNVSLVRTSIVLVATSIILVGCNKEIPIDDNPTGEKITIGTTQSQTTTTVLQTKNTETETTPDESITETSDTTVPEESEEEETVTTTEESFFGYSLTEIDSIATSLYNDACTKYRNVLIDCSYGVDFQDSITIQNGTRFFAVNNPYYTTVDDVLNDWHNVFTQDLDYLVTSAYTMYDDKLFAYTAIQQKNTNFNSTNLVYYYPTGDYELTYKATSSYSSGDKVFKFSIQYNPDTDEWRVSKFTMPY
jgi:hypothetical protein